MKKQRNRYLSKSRYKLALECPTKLFYTGKDQLYANQKVDDPFLLALAQGGFQVEELARMEYPEGILVECEHYQYNEAIEMTNELLRQENVVIFEAAFARNNLFIRTDILVKKGDSIELIEVKAKSFDPNDQYTFIGKRGGIDSKWKPYLFDVAFQHYVISKSNPHWKIESFLMLADKTKKAQINGMNQLFRISRNKQNRTGITKIVSTKEELGETILTKENISAIVKSIQSDDPKVKAELNFEEGIKLFASSYEEDKKMEADVTFSVCKKCEFRSSSTDGDKLSGFEECWTTKMGFTSAQLAKPNLFEVWNLRGEKYIKDYNVFLLEDMTEDLFMVKPEAGLISSTERQWIQIEKSRSANTTPHVLREELQHEMSTWNFPLHMIDFETSTVALPFYNGMRPYEQVAFQFSHHMIHEDGRVEHASQFLHFERGSFPNFDFLRALKKSLGSEGTIFRFHNHENSILNAIYVQLMESKETDKEELMAFIQHISHSKSKSTIEWKGERDMVDLNEVYRKYVYLPETKGSNSIKAVLPAMLKQSKFIQNKYAQPLGQLNMTSSNFDPSHCWLKTVNGEVQNPYAMLPPLFANWSNDQLDELFSDMEDLNNGGAALTAYGYLQYTDMSELERQELMSGLLRYCELDTLAMVMIYEGFKEMVGE
jgi:hypothetical protein